MFEKIYIPDLTMEAEHLSSAEYISQAFIFFLSPVEPGERKEEREKGRRGGYSK
jgi:hypothetical protein